MKHKIKLIKYDNYKYQLKYNWFNKDEIEVYCFKEIERMINKSDYSILIDILVDLKIQYDQMYTLQYALNIYFIKSCISKKKSKEENLFSLRIKADNLINNEERKANINEDDIHNIVNLSSINFNRFDEHKRNTINYLIIKELSEEYYKLYTTISEYSNMNSDSIIYLVYSRYLKELKQLKIEEYSKLKFIASILHSGSLYPDDYFNVIDYLRTKKTHYTDNTHDIKDYKTGIIMNYVSDIEIEFRDCTIFKYGFYYEIKPFDSTRAFYNGLYFILDGYIHLLFHVRLPTYLTYIEDVELVNGKLELVKNINFNKRNKLNSVNGLSKQNTHFKVRIFDSRGKSIDIRSDEISNKYYDEFYPFMYKFILDSENNPCLISTSLYERITINGNLPDIIKIKNYIVDKIIQIKTSTESSLANEFYNAHIEYKYRNAINTIKTRNSEIETFYKNTLVKNYFLNNFICNARRVKSESKYFSLFKSDTKSLDDDNFFNRATLAYDMYLKNEIIEYNWCKNSNVEIINDCCEISFANEYDINREFTHHIAIGENLFFLKLVPLRSDKDQVIELSIRELKSILKNQDIYFIAILTYMDEGNSYTGIKINDEFYLRYYKLKSETIELIGKSIEEWEVYFKKDSITFSLNHLDIMSSSHIEDINDPCYLEYPKISEDDKDKIPSFITSYLYKDIDNKKECYGRFDCFKVIFEEYEKLRKNTEFNLDNIYNFVNELMSSNSEDDLPF